MKTDTMRYVIPGGLATNGLRANASLRSVAEAVIRDALRAQREADAAMRAEGEAHWGHWNTEERRASANQRENARQLRSIAQHLARHTGAHLPDSLR